MRFIGFEEKLVTIKNYEISAYLFNAIQIYKYRVTRMTHHD